MTILQIQSETEYSPDAARTSQGPKLLMQVSNAQTGSTRLVFRRGGQPAVALQACQLFNVTPVLAPPSERGFDAFDKFLEEVSRDERSAVELAAGRQWVADSFGSRDLASLRLSAGLSQAELASRCGLEQPHVSRFESGRHEPLLSTAQRMAKALDVSLEQLFAAWSLSRDNNVRRTE